jgi:phenylphosphate carboxylase alpha subunit
MVAKPPPRIDRAAIPRSYRDYLAQLQAMGEAVAIDDEVDWELEIGAILRYASETRAPMPIFNKVKDAPGFRAAEYGPTLSSTPGKTWRRLAMLMGLPHDTTPSQMQPTYLAARSEPPHPPVIVEAKDAPCKENRWTGDRIDLNRLPAPLLHDGDRGRYIQTAGAITVRTPCGKWTNWSLSRGMIVDKNTMTGLWLPFQHNGMIYNLWKAQGRDCPFAIALGVPPAAMTTLSAAPPDWKDEYDYASALLGEGIEMVKCETSEILVPAHSEIIIEGVVSATQKSIEGPFGEYPGYLGDTSGQQPTAHIVAVTFRDNAILPICSPGVPVDSCLVNSSFFMAGDAVVVLQEAGLPVIDGMYLAESAGHWFVIRVRDDWHHTTGYTVEEFIGKIAEAYFTSHCGHGCSTLIIVGEDIPPDDAMKVMWAFATRNNPEQGVYHFPKYKSDGSGLQIYLDVATKMAGRGDLVAYSCLQIQEKVNHPLEPVLSFEENYPLPLQQAIRSKWKDWGFPA